MCCGWFTSTTHLALTLLASSLSFVCCFPSLQLRFPLHIEGIQRSKATATNVHSHEISTWATTHWAHRSSPCRCRRKYGALFANEEDEGTSVEDTLAKLQLIDFAPSWRKYSSSDRISNSPLRVWQREIKWGGHEPAPFHAPVCFVHGPSGSGKTFFARTIVANLLYQNMYKRTKNVTLYLSPKAANVKFVSKDESDGSDIINHRAPKELFDWIKSALGQRSIEIRRKLDMHVCIIIDDVSAEDVQSCFQDWDLLFRLCSQAKEFAQSTVVAVCSTGFTRYDREWKSGVHTFRLDKWDENDLQETLSSFQAELGLRREEGHRTRHLAKALWEHPKLGALATNGYMANSMVKAFSSVWSGFNRDPWNSKLDDIAFHVVPRVIQDYLEKYGISALSPKQQRRIAASVFRVLEQGKGRVEGPQAFLGVTGIETVLAQSFLLYNSDGYGDGFTITVTPAQELVLVAMAGISMTLMARWKTEEQLAVFYVVRQAMLQCMEQFADNAVNGMENNVDGCLEQLDDSLENIHLYRLEKCFETDHETTYRYVPMVDVGAITINGNAAPFADIIAPYTLIQTWRRSSPLPLLENLQKELQKCGLFKEDGNTRVLQGLLALWQLRTNSLDQGIWQPNVTTNGGVSLPPTNPVRYTLNEAESGIDITVCDGTDIGLSRLDGTTITFLIATDAETIELRLAVHHPLVKVTKANIGDDMELNMDTLSDVERLVWTKYVSDKIREEVRIKFLFTSKQC